jgi:hypothetical protein
VNSAAERRARLSKSALKRRPGPPSRASAAPDPAPAALPSDLPFAQAFAGRTPPSSESGPAPPSNCGHGPGGSAELGFEVDALQALEQNAAASPEALPPAFYAQLRAQGFTWVFFTNFPPNANLDAVREAAHCADLQLLVDHAVTDSHGPDDGLVLVDSDPETAYHYCFDPTLLRHLRAGQQHSFIECLERDDLHRMVHFSTQDGFAFAGAAGFVASAALLLLPGMRVLRNSESAFAPQLLAILTRKVVRSGTFSIPEVQHIFGRMAVWKYASDSERVIVCLNFVNGHAAANVLCPDAPDNVGGDKIEVFELLTETTTRRAPEELRADGLHVALHEYAIQIFSY